MVVSDTTTFQNVSILQKVWAKLIFFILPSVNSKKMKIRQTTSSLLYYMSDVMPLPPKSTTIKHLKDESKWSQVQYSTDRIPPGFFPFTCYSLKALPKTSVLPLLPCSTLSMPV